jgi:hypothetical protein
MNNSTVFIIFYCVSLLFSHIFRFQVAILRFKMVSFSFEPGCATTKYLRYSKCCLSLFSGFLFNA